jgi:hypothetical protein
MPRARRNGLCAPLISSAPVARRAGGSLNSANAAGATRQIPAGATTSIRSDNPGPDELQYPQRLANGGNQFSVAIWIASEYIGQTCTLTQYLTGSIGSCGGTRTSLGNWDTRISKLAP